MHWDDARFFLAVARAGSLSGAARALGCSHSTVKRRLDELERALGVALFVATASGLRTTEVGARLRSPAEQMEATVAEMKRAAAEESVALGGEVVLSTVDVLVEDLGPALEALAVRQPSLAIKVLVGNRYVDLGQREADVAVRLGQSSDEALVGRRLGSHRYAPFARPNLAERHQGDIGRMPWVLWDERLEATQTEQWFASVTSGETQRVYRVDSGSAMVALVKTGLAGAALPTSVAARHGLTPLGPEIESFRTDIWCVSHRDVARIPRVRALLDALYESAFSAPE